MMLKEMFKLYKLSGLEDYNPEAGFSALARATLICTQLTKAESFLSRAKGLLGRSELLEQEALWIKPCNNIHTYFMKFPIDCVFIDKKMKVVKTKSHIPAFKIVGPIWKSSSVIELPAGTIRKFNIQEGDTLYVVN